MARELEGLVATAETAGGSLEFTVGSEADGQLLASVGEQTALYLVAHDGTITKGQLLIGDPVGSQPVWPGFHELSAAGAANILPFSHDGLPHQHTGMPAVLLAAA